MPEIAEVGITGPKWHEIITAVICKTLDRANTEEKVCMNIVPPRKMPKRMFLSKYLRNIGCFKKMSL
jgi:hypothetical protein